MCVCACVSLCALFTYSREIPAAHANPWACPRLPLPPPDDDDDDDANADASADASADAYVDAYDDDGRAWDGRRCDGRPLRHSGHALRQLQQRSLHPMPSYDGRGPRPTARQRNRCYDVPCSCMLVLSFIDKRTRAAHSSLCMCIYETYTLYSFIYCYGDSTLI